MPIVSQGQILPREIARPSAWGDFGYMQGHQADKLTSALLAMFTGGMYQGGQNPVQPTPQRPGQLQFPSGQSTNTSPDELAQIMARGGVPSRSGETVPFGTGAPNAVSYQPPTKWGIRPGPDFQLKQVQLQKAQQELDPNSPNNVLQRDILSRMYPAQDGVKPDGGADNEFLTGLASLGAQAESGDERAVQKIRLIRQLMATQ